jgi:HD-GYP domain-containing protein (c-di-GMP phosphodiesterase class II)
MILGAAVSDPRSPDTPLLRQGVELEPALIASMRSRGVTQVWVEDDLTRDLDAAVAAELTAARTEVYTRLKDDIAALSRTTLTVTSVQAYRQAVMGLVLQSISSAQYAGLTDTLFSADGLATHSANVAYLSLLCGLHIETYVVHEQQRLDREQARDMTVLGLAGMLHDLGKTRMKPKDRGFHEVHEDEKHPFPEAYREHTGLGHKMLEDARAPARVAHAVLNHHQRFDGTGWPDLSAVTGGRISGPLRGQQIHIFSRIVSAANVLDNLLRDAEGHRRPPVAALWEFASARYDGWFDPIVRRAMLARIPPFAVGAEVRLSDGRRGIVATPSVIEPCRPVVRILSDAKGVRMEQARTVDLAETPGLAITHSLGEDVGKYLYDVPAVAPTPTDAGERVNRRRDAA